MNKELKEHTAFEEVVVNEIKDNISGLRHLFCASLPDDEGHCADDGFEALIDVRHAILQAHQRELNKAVVEELERLGTEFQYEWLDNYIDHRVAKYTPKESRDE